jgi:hypothetical protein
MIETLLNAGADVNAQDDLGMTALMCCARQNNMETVGILLDAGADINMRDKKGNTAMEYAKEFALDKDIIRTLSEVLYARKTQKTNVELCFEVGEEVSIGSKVNLQKKFAGEITEISNGEIEIIDSSSGKTYRFNLGNLSGSGNWEIKKISCEHEPSVRAEEKSSKETSQKKERPETQELER